MHCTYINLDHKTDRKALIEKNLADNKAASWTFERFSAVDTAYVQTHKIPGTLRDGEKACFLSHKYALKQHLHTKDHLMLIEDDILFGQKTCQTIDDVVTKHANADWDIFFAEVCVPDVPTMFTLVKMRQQWLETKQTSLLNLKKIHFASSAAYIVNAKSKQKVLNLLEKSHMFNIPYDLYLRRLVHEDKLNAFAIFPFVVSFSEEALTSSIREENEKATDLLWTLYRKLIWQERDIAKESTTLKFVKDHLVDEESEAFAAIMSAMLSSKFVVK